MADWQQTPSTALAFSTDAVRWGELSKARPLVGRRQLEEADRQSALDAMGLARAANPSGWQPVASTTWVIMAPSARLADGS